MQEIKMIQIYSASSARARTYSIWRASPADTHATLPGTNQAIVAARFCSLEKPEDNARALIKSRSAISRARALKQYHLIRRPRKSYRKIQRARGFFIYLRVLERRASYAKIKSKR